MKIALLWMKNNPIAVVAVILCICSLMGLVVVRFQASSFMKEIEERNSVVQKVINLKSTRVKIPSPDLDISVEERDITINEPAIEALKDVYGKMAVEYRNIFALAVDQNRKGHDPLLDGLFPDPGINYDKLYDARVEYRNAFESMLLYYSPTDIYPRLNAGESADMGKLSAEVELEQNNYLLRQGLENSSLELLTAKQQLDLSELRRGVAYRVLRQHASKYHIFVDSLEDSGMVFQIDPWSLPGPSPTLPDIWQGQMGLWVQQDIVQALGTANNIWNASMNAMQNPVKKLNNISVMPSYVGITTTGALTQTGILTTGQPNSGETRLPNGFLMSPTGRRSNTIYDVLHAKVSLVVDYQQMSKLFEAIGKTNFMTILNISITDVDEYEALQSGYLYGSGDCVQVDLIIETLWLREWTVRLMPKSIKTLLAIETKDKEQQ